MLLKKMLTIIKRKSSYTNSSSTKDAASVAIVNGLSNTYNNLNAIQMENTALSSSNMMEQLLNKPFGGSMKSADN